MTQGYALTCWSGPYSSLLQPKVEKSLAKGSLRMRFKRNDNIRVIARNLSKVDYPHRGQTGKFLRYYPNPSVNGPELAMVMLVESKAVLIELKSIRSNR